MKIAASTFLATGGSSGLGAACVQMLSEEGANIVIAGLNATEGERIAAAVRSARFVRTDVTDEAGVQNAVDATIKFFGRLNGALRMAPK